MTAFGIPDPIAAQVADDVFGPGSRLHPDRVEIVLMALMKVAPDLYALWVENRPQCASKNVFGATCEMPVGHPAWHAGHLGGTSIAWMDEKAPSIPLPPSINTKPAVRSKQQCEWWWDAGQCPDWAEDGKALCRTHIRARERGDVA